MRLIDADTLLENYNLKNMHKYNADGSLNRQATNTLMLYEIADMIDDMPTAYDVDKVVKEILDINVELFGHRTKQGVITSLPDYRVKIINIIKRGGTDEI